MRSRRLGWTAFFAASLVFWGVFPAAWAQGPSGHTSVATDYEFFGLSELSGGGHVVWTLAGDHARLLRGKILGLFDGYVQIPRGFPYFPAATSGNLNGRIDAAEALAYTNFLENELEGLYRTPVGTEIGYFRLDRADLYEKDTAGAVERSTSGLVGSDVNSVEDLQIRFLFNGYARTPKLSLALATRVYADALHAIFTVHQEQAATLNGTGGYPGAWPLQTGGGWHRVVGPGGYPSLWHGNDTTGFYEGLASQNMTTFADPVLGHPWTDLRFATSASVSFYYTGQVRDANDTLRLEVASEPDLVNWTSLSYANRTDFPGTPTGTWDFVQIDLGAFLGKRVRFRFAFSSDGFGSDAPGFYVRGFTIHAPSVHVGSLVESDAHYLVGTLSFSDVAVSTGGFQLIRTPGGEILFYSATWDPASPPADRVTFQTFDLMENPQLLFAVMIVASYFISRAQETAYDRYREAHPSIYRPAVRKAKLLHVLGKASMLLLVLLYFVPSVFFFLGIRLFVSGPAYIFLALTLALSVGFGTRAYYEQRLEEHPPPEVPAPAPAGVPVVAVPEAAPPREVARCTHCLREIAADERTYRCSCGAEYHLACASGLLRCTTCRKPVTVEVVRKKVSLSMRCESCGEVQTMEEGVDPRAVPCAACGGRLRRLDEGKGYLLVASNPSLAFSWLKDLTKGGKPALVLSPAASDRLRLEFGLKGVEILRISSADPKGIDPKKLDPAALRSVLALVKPKRGGVLLYDALEEMIAASNLGDLIRFVRKANDIAFVNRVTVIARVAPGALAPEEMARLGAEFDETMDLTAKV